MKCLKVLASRSVAFLPLFLLFPLLRFLFHPFPFLVFLVQVVQASFLAVWFCYFLIPESWFSCSYEGNETSVKGTNTPCVASPYKAIENAEVKGDVSGCNGDSATVTASQEIQHACAQLRSWPETWPSARCSCYLSITLRPTDNPVSQIQLSRITYLEEECRKKHEFFQQGFGVLHSGNWS